jgi:hypothetical protein
MVIHLFTHFIHIFTDKVHNCGKVVHFSGLYFCCFLYGCGKVTTGL